MTIEATFTLPDTLTVRQQLRFTERVSMRRIDGYLVGYWEAGVPLITNWQCEIIADPTAVDLDKETDPRVTAIVINAANKISEWYAGLGDVEKN